MPAQDPRQAPYVDLDPSKTTRREALSEALRPGRHLDQPRAYSTLVQRLTGELTGEDDCAYCGALIRACVSHLAGHVALEDFPSGYEALLAAIEAFPSHRASAGGTDSDDEKVEQAGGADPESATES
jgi:hypothetical protein